MKNIFITQRAGTISEELRDSLDSRWLQFMENCNLIPILIPNNEKILKYYLSIIECDGIILSGGDNIYSLGGLKSRDDIETFLINLSISKNIPLLGVCRGMQKIQDFFGIKLTKVQGNIQENQEIYIDGEKHNVNSYHEYGTKINNENFNIWAIGKDNIIKGISHSYHKISGVMWHPERIVPSREYDINLFRKFFG